MGTNLKAVSALLFVSGATALTYEVVWGKWLATVLGNSGQAHAVVLAVFLFGLALGAFVFGGVADRSQSPLRLYALLELAVALYGLAFEWVLKALSGAYLSLGGGLFAKLFFAGLAVLPPTVLMGGTLLPVVRHATRQLSELRERLALLYAVNALGAALGALVAGMVLLPTLGLRATGWVAVSLNLAVALAAQVLSKEALPAAAAAAAATDEPTYSPRDVAAARAGAALSGFASMALQIAWIRAFTLVLGASTYAFTLILTAFILGIGLGSLGLLRVRQRNALLVFGTAQALVAVTVAAGLNVYERLPYWMWQLSHSVSHAPEGWPLFQAISFALCASVLLVPTTLLGASFPAVARVGAAQEAASGRRLGTIYLWNTAGAVTGALLGGLWLMPATTMEGCVAAALGASLLASALTLGSARGVKGLAAASVATLATVAAFHSATEWPRVLANAGSFRQSRPPPETFAAFRTQTLEADFELLRRDDTFATVVVGGNKVSGTRFLRINGKVDASDSNDDMSTQILLGQLGPLLHRGDAKTALVIGLGAGITVGSLLTHESIERVDVVEISPAVVDAAAEFGTANRNALNDPRVHLVVDDARTFLASSGAKYDVIVSEPSNPWVAGVAGLFTREFFHLVREHLAEGGLLVQWQHLYETDLPMVQLIVRTLRDTFAHSTGWLGELDLLMVASDSEMNPDVAKLQQVLASWSVGADLGRIGVVSAPAFLAVQVQTDEGQRELAGEGPINTDDQNLLEFLAPRAFFLHGPRVQLHDERADPKVWSRLPLWAWKGDRVLTSLEASQIHAAMLYGSRLDTPAVVLAANEWLRVAPADLNAKDAVAASALAQGNAQLAVDLMVEVVSQGIIGDEAAVRFARAVAALEDATKTQWSGSPSVLQVLKAVLLKAGSTPDLEKAVARFCRGTEREECLKSVQPYGVEAEEKEAPPQ